MIWKAYLRRPIGVVALVILALFFLVGLYAPMFASSKPLVVKYDGHLYFPLFRYLLYRGFYTRGIDIFYNILMFTFPFAVIVGFMGHQFRRYGWTVLLVIQLGLTVYVLSTLPQDPASSPVTEELRPTWSQEVATLSPYAKLNMVLKYRLRKAQHERLTAYDAGQGLPTLWQGDRDNAARDIERLSRHGDAQSKARLHYVLDKQKWLQDQQDKVDLIWMPLIRDFHWEEDAGGSQALNQRLPWYELTRVNRKDLVASLIFGIRVSVAVGLSAVILALLIGLPLGLTAGYYGGGTDIVVSRFIEIWESMPTFFMLLMTIAILQTKSVFIVITVLGIFGWTGIARFLRAEVLKTRGLAYIEACHAIGYKDPRIMFTHILPNAIPPVLTILPFSVMAAITAEAGLSFLGLGEEGSTSWGVLMDEGRSVFPHESYLLWPPAILLTVMLIAIAIAGDVLRDALDPKLRS